MKEAELLPAVLAGRRIVVGEFRDWDAREIPDKKTNGQFNVIESTFVVVGRESVPVERFAERGKRKVDLVRPGFKAGERVVIEFENWEHTQYGLRVRGKVEPLVK